MVRIVSFLSLLALLALTGCASRTGFELPSATPDYSELYLRGVFNWWEADDQYRVQELGTDLYGAEVKLIADGQPYDFKFADSHWTPGLSCGSYRGDDSVTIQLHQTLSARCDNPQGNFQFTPDRSGVYQFSIDFSDHDNPQVFVQYLREK
ncbi:hypothetical protein LJ739_11765 [Aestuariibacter halophilus]|uniref:Pullulanase n=1 Tax=Fluctibacter halophilus TaxID=226011 RepID=A0ABS8G8R6_9ALTE|nr:hypothetical protein [Aestuariibacter halophilus]MCC2616918.1 hypothetical protein [Aestuariibacter halophilus]